MEKVRETLGISKGGGAMGIGTDQSALLQNEDFKKDVEGGDEAPASASNEPEVPQHKSELLNKLDPRIGFTPEELDKNIAKYEAKYGKPEIGEQKEGGYPGSKMGGMGADQGALVDSEGHM